MEPPEQRKWDEVTPEGLYNIIQYLKGNFDAELSRKVIELFHERMRDDIGFDPALLDSLMKHVFALIMEGRSADQAFGLTAIKGKYSRPDNTSRDVRAAAIMALQMRKGVNWEDAVTDTAMHMVISDRTVERAYEAYKAGFELLPDEPLMQIAGDSNTRELLCCSLSAKGLRNRVVKSGSKTTRTLLTNPQKQEGKYREKSNCWRSKLNDRTRYSSAK